MMLRLATRHQKQCAALPSTIRLRHFATTPSHRGPIELAELALCSMRDASGLPWWACIVSTTIAARTLITLPLAVHQRLTMQRLQRYRPQFQAMCEQLEHDVAVYSKQRMLSEAATRSLWRGNLRMKRRELYLKYKCHPMVQFLCPIVQIPMWITFSLTLRQMSTPPPSPITDSAADRRTALQKWHDESDSTPIAQRRQRFVELQSGGFGSFSDLTTPSYALAGIVFCLNFLLVQQIRRIFAASAGTSPLARWMGRLARASPFITAGMAALVPSTVSLFWASSSAFGLVQNLFLPRMDGKAPTAANWPTVASKLLRRLMRR